MAYDLEILQFEGGVFPRYRNQNNQHSDQWLTDRLASMGYFGPVAGNYLGRRKVSVLETANEGKLGVRVLKQYFTSIKVNILKRQPHSELIEQFQLAKKKWQAEVERSADIDSYANDVQILWDQLSDVFSDAELAERGLTRS